MAKNQEGVRITFKEMSDPWDPDPRYIKFDEDNFRSWPAAIKSPEAGVDLVMQNFGKGGVVKDPVMLKSMFGNGEFDSYFAGYTRSPYYDAIPQREYESLLDVFKAAYEGDPDAAESVNNLINESNRFKIRNSRR